MLTNSAVLEIVKNLNGQIYFNSTQSNQTEETKICIEHLSYDSRKIDKNSAFFCLPGQHNDGNMFSLDAIKSGASCIVSERKQDLDICQIIVPDVRLALASFANNFFDQPSKNIRILGITGTNGKTTTTHLIEHIFNFAQRNTGLIGTLGWRVPGVTQYSDAKHTTPQAPELQALISQMQKNGCSHIAMEVSSHALSLQRVAECNFALACLTNISQDHLDFHRTMDNYWKAKRILFESLNYSVQTNKAAIINLDDHLAKEFIGALGKSVKVITYGFNPKADIYPISHSFNSGITYLELASPYGNFEFKTNLLGKFNIYNLMAAIAIALVENIAIKTITESLTSFVGVPGRFEKVNNSLNRNEPLCIVDYAHTPDGLDNVLKTAAELKPKDGKLIVVFGCGGDRDPSKRPKMGSIAESIADHVIITSDNPRSENPQEIIAQILSGIRRLKQVDVEADRKQAIELAISSAGPNDIILVAGKGHENYQLINDMVLDFDDRIEISNALKNMTKVTN